VAIIPSLQRTDRYKLQIVRIMHRRKPIQERVAIQWDKRRPLPSYAESFCDALVDYMSEALPITHPTKRKMQAREQLRPKSRKRRSKNGLRSAPRVSSPEQWPGRSS
jgi:hypothetical protein